MKKALSVLIALCTITLYVIPDLSAQSLKKPMDVKPDTTQFLGFYKATAGPFFTGGISTMNENVTPGWHSDPSFAYSFGGVVALDLNWLIGIQLGVAYDARELYNATSNDSAIADIGVQYLSIQPSIRIFWLIVGLAFDLPMSGAATISAKDFNSPGTYEENRNVENRDINGGMEIRGGLSIPVYKAESGELHVLLTGSYPLKPVLSGTTSFDTVGGAVPKPNLNKVFSDVGKGPVPTFQAGISYQFDLTKLK